MHLPFILTALTSAILSLRTVSAANDFGYYIDPSCNRFPGFGDAVNQARQMAGLVLKRIDMQPPDPDFERVLTLLFEDARTDDIDDIRTPFEAIQLLWEVPQAGNPESDDQRFQRLKDSQYRFFCDNDGVGLAEAYTNDPRTSPVRLVPKPIDGISNPGAWYDIKNHVISEYDTPSNRPWCVETSATGTGGAHTTTGDGAIRVDPNDATNPHFGQHENRVVMTFCDDIFANTVTDGEQHPFLVKVDNQNINYQKIDRYAFSISAYVLHELIHATFEQTVDLAGGYEWTGAVSFDHSAQVNNAHNYAILGVFALLAESKYTLRRDSDRNSYVSSWSQAQIASYQASVDESIRSGTLMRYDDIRSLVRRALGRIAKAFRA